MSGWRRALLAFAMGALAVLGQPPYDFFAACFVAFPILVWLLDAASADRPQSMIGAMLPAFSVGWWFGFGYFLAGLWWLGNALLIEAESFAWALPLAVIALPAALALFWGLAAAIAQPFWHGESTRIAALAFGFGLSEWLRAVAFTGFPWNAIGYAAMPVPLLMQSSAMVGLFGMNALAVFVFAAPALLAAPRPAKAGLALAAFIVAAHVGFGVWRLSTADAAGNGETLSFRIVQPSIDQTQKWDAQVREEIFARHLDLTRRAGEGAPPAIIIWPETSVPFLLSARPDALAAIGAALGEEQMLLAGAVRAEGEGPRTRFYNSLVAIAGNGEIVDAADKLHLVPFGEYLPFADLLEALGLQTIAEVPGRFSAGGQRRLLELGKGMLALPLICYEIIFPNEVIREAEKADIIINVTNDAWYGDTPGPHQHFRQAQLRAVETGLPLLRSANNGISGAVDPYGRIIDALALNAVGAVEGVLSLKRPPAPLAGNPTANGWYIMGAMGLIALAGLRRKGWRQAGSSPIY
jgi:apolipoprotein N-acyltransferase